MKIKEKKIGGNVKSESKENKTESRLWQKWIKSGRSIVLPLGQQKNHRTPTMKRVEEKWVGKSGFDGKGKFAESEEKTRLKHKNQQQWAQ